MTANMTKTDRAIQPQLDRLVAGELPEGERRKLLAWLDEDAGRWRACALAFLEAQMWEAAASDWPEAPRSPANSVAVKPACEKPVASRSRGWASLVVVAAAVVLAFAAGQFAARLGPQTITDEPTAPKSPSAEQPQLLASVTVRTSLNPNVPAQLQVPVTAVAADAPPQSGISDYERKQWEKRGFELQEERRYLPAKLPDGTPVLVPVNKVQVRLKGTPVS